MNPITWKAQHLPVVPYLGNLHQNAPRATTGLHDHLVDAIAPREFRHRHAHSPGINAPLFNHVISSQRVGMCRCVGPHHARVDTSACEQNYSLARMQPKPGLSTPDCCLFPPSQVHQSASPAHSVNSTRCHHSLAIVVIDHPLRI